MMSELETLAQQVVMLARMLQLATENKDGKATIRYVNSIGLLLNKVSTEVLSNAEKTE